MMNYELQPSISLGQMDVRTFNGALCNGKVILQKSKQRLSKPLCLTGETTHRAPGWGQKHSQPRVVLNCGHIRCLQRDAKRAQQVYNASRWPEFSGC